MRWIGAVVIVLGVVLLLVGIAYVTIENQNLPSFLGPIKGQLAHDHRTKRAAAGLAGGAILMIVGIVAYVRGGKQKVAASTTADGDGA
jgi:hypothetical protein